MLCGFQDHTKGLFGVWNGDLSNDLQTITGEFVSADDPNDYIHSVFGLSWMVAEQDSRFHYYGDHDYDYFSEYDFTPNFDVPAGDVGNITGTNDVT